MRILLILLLFIPIGTFAQISGKISDSNSNEALYGVKIISSDGQKAISTISGEYTITPKTYPVWIKFSIFGYTEDSIRVTKPGFHNVEMTPITTEIKTVVVTAGRRNQEIQDVPISMEIIKPELINNKGFSNLEKAVNQSPGVFAMDGQVSIRGGGGYAYGAGSRVMLLWNGIPMLSPDVGDAKWNAVPMEQSSQIEILKGASSVLYGSGALNGIIALTEKEPSTKGEFKAKIQSGVYCNPKRSSLKWWNHNPTFHMADLYYGKAYKKIGFTVGANMYYDSSYKQGAQEKRLRINGSIYFRPKNDKIKAGISYNAQYQDQGIFVLWKNDSMGFQAMDNTLSRQKAIRINFDPYVKFYDKHNNKHYIRSRYYLVTTGNSDNIYNASFAQMYYLDYQIQRKLSEGINITGGVTNNTSTVKSYVFDNHLAINAAAYGQIEAKIRKWDLSAGMRLEYYQLDTMQPDSKFKMGDSLNIPIYPVFRAGAHYAINKASHLRFSLGQGVRFPSIAERFVSTSVGGLVIFRNPNLKPEKGWAGEVGFKQIVKLGQSWKGFIDVAAFVNQYSNMTEFTFGIYKPDTMLVLQTTDPEALNYLYKWVGFQAQNAEKARITGLELSFNSQGKIGDVELTSLLGYTYMNPVTLNRNAEYRKTFSDTNSNMLKYRFNHLVKADIQATYKKFSIGFSSRYNSYMKNIDAIFITPIGGSTYLLPGLKEYREKFNKGSLVFDARMSYDIMKEIKINFIANNIFNAEYVSRPGDHQAPRNFLLQMQFSF